MGVTGKFLTILSLSLMTNAAQATMTFSASGYSTAVTPAGQTNPIYYYSNISSTNSVTDNSTGTPVLYWGDGGGTGCPNARNPQCLNLTGNPTPFTVNVSSTVQTAGSTGTMYLIVSTLPLTTANFVGQSLTGTSTVGTAFVSSQPYPGATPATNLAFPVSFGSICAAYVSAYGQNPSNTGAVTINSNCTLAAGTPGNTTPGPSGPATGATMYLNFILQTVASQQTYTADANSDIGYVEFVVDSAIPQNSVIASSIGFYGWTAFPGDGQIHIKNITVDNNFPATENAGVGVQTVRFYYNTTGFDNTLDATGGAASQDLQITGAAGNVPSLTSYYINGLTNGTKYYFRAALVDFAGNIGFRTLSPTDDIASHAAAPDQIAGLLSKNGECFIATAAFGTPMAKQVEILRAFRGRFLMKTQWGRNFVSFYYRHSPPWAEKLRQSEGARAVVRTLLYPIIAFSWLALKFGGANASLLFATLLLLPLLLYRLKKSAHLLAQRRPRV